MEEGSGCCVSDPLKECITRILERKYHSRVEIKTIKVSNATPEDMYYKVVASSGPDPMMKPDIEVEIRTIDCLGREVPYTLDGNLLPEGEWALDTLADFGIFCGDAFEGNRS